eukprot:SAG11_NODE_3247_length_2583_cov_2.255233_3_plen_541_part_00
MASATDSNNGSDGLVEIELSHSDFPRKAALGVRFGHDQSSWPTLTSVVGGSPIATALSRIRDDSRLDARGLTLTRIRGPGLGANPLPVDFDTRGRSFDDGAAAVRRAGRPLRLTLRLPPTSEQLAAILFSGAENQNTPTGEDDVPDWEDLEDFTDSDDSELLETLASERLEEMAAIEAICQLEDISLVDLGIAESTHDLPSWRPRWSTAALCADGTVVCPPTWDSRVLIVPVSTSSDSTRIDSLHSTKFLPVPASIRGTDEGGSSQWVTCATGGDGVVYAPPYASAQKVLSVAPGGIVSSLDLPPHDRLPGSGWAAAVTAADGSVCCPPSGSDSVLVIRTCRSGGDDASEASVEMLPLPDRLRASRALAGARGGSLWMAAAVGGDGNVYAPPCHADSVLVIEPAGCASCRALPLPTRVKSRCALSGERPITADKEFKWQAAATGGDGRVCKFLHLRPVFATRNRLRCLQRLGLNMTLCPTDCPPSFAECVLAIDPGDGDSRPAEVAALQLPPGVSSGRGKWLSAAMGARMLLVLFWIYGC